VGDLVWGLAHLESDGLSCDSTVGLRSADVETNGNKPCECSTRPMPSKPLSHRARPRCRLGPTPAGGQAPDTRQRESGVPVCPGGDRLLRRRSHSLKTVPPDRRMTPGPVVALGSPASFGERAQAQRRVQAVERSARGATATRTLGRLPERRQARVVTGGIPGERAGAPARIAAAARPLPRCDLCLDAPSGLQACLIT
jgi:hypothetical protein